MIAVCGIGNPNGRRNSATTAYQSARPPMVAASAKAATKPKAGCRCNSALAAMNTASVLASTSVASALTRRNSAARAASPGASNENVPETVMAAFRADEVIHRCCAHGRHLDASDTSCPGRGAAFFTLLRRAGTDESAGLMDPGSAAHRYALRPGNAGMLSHVHHQKEGPREAGLE